MDIVYDLRVHPNRLHSRNLLSTKPNRKSKKVFQPMDIQNRSRLRHSIRRIAGGAKKVLPAYRYRKYIKISPRPIAYIPRLVYDPLHRTICIPECKSHITDNRNRHRRGIYIANIRHSSPGKDKTIVHKVTFYERNPMLHHRAISFTIQFTRCDFCESSY
jgi:hypothetical protein